MRRLLRGLFGGLLLGMMFGGTAWGQGTEGLTRDVLDLFSKKEERVREVRVEGARRISPSTVRAYAELQEGDTYSEELAEATLVGLYGTGLFRDVEITWDSGVLTVRVEEHPIVNALVFRGNVGVGVQELARASGLSARAVYSESIGRRAADGIRAAYRRAGYYGAVVVPRPEDIGAGRVNLAFVVQEGEKARIRAVNFIGNEAYTDDQLRTAILTDESRWWKLLTSTDTYDPDRFRLDAEALRRFYFDRGYADFTVLESHADLSPDGSGFFLTFWLEEGRLYRFGESKVEVDFGDGAFLGFGELGLDVEELRLEALSAVEHKEGGLYSRELIGRSLDGVRDKLGKSALPFVRVAPSVDRDEEGGLVTVTYRLEEGPRAYVERIEIEGNVGTHERVIRREMEFVEGDALDTLRLSNSLRGIRRLGYFGDVQLNQAPGENPDGVVVRVDVQERATGQLSLGLSYSTSESFAADVSLTQNNFLGLGHRLSAGLRLGEGEDQAHVSFSNSSLFGSGVGFSVRESYTVDKETTYDVKSLDTSLGFTFPLSTDATLTTTYRYEIEDLTNILEGAGSAVRELEGETTHSVVGYRYELDKRDNAGTPRDGWYWLFSQELSGLGGDVKYLLTSFDYRKYKSLAEGWTGLLRMRGGYIDGLGDPVRITDAFALGGLSFRGFDSSGIGVWCNDGLSGLQYLRSKMFLIGTAQLAFPLRKLEEAGMFTYVFADVGVAGKTDNTSCFSSDADYDRTRLDLRATFGVTVHWRSPIGPVQFDFNWPVVRERYDDTESFRFSIGTSF